MRKFLDKQNNSLGMKLAVFCASLVLGLAVLEAGLRLGGFTSSRDRVFVPPYDEEDSDLYQAFERFRRGGRRARLILTFGDSLTSGDNVKSYESYPYHLYQGLSDAGLPAAVYNMGYGQDSTFGVASKLGTYFKSQDALPDAVVILVGAADLFNLPWVKERMMRDNGFWRDVLPRSWVRELRLYEAYRRVRAGSRPKRKPQEPGGGITPRKKLELLLEAYQKHKKNLGPGKPKGLSPELAQELAPYFEEDLSEAELGDAVDFMDLIAHYGSVVYVPQSRYDEFFGLLLDMAGTFPEDFWYNHSDVAGFKFFQTYQAQSRYAAEDVAKVLDKTAAAHPRVAGRESYKTFRRLLADREAMDRYVDRRRMRAWDEIVRLCREKGVKIVLQNYPVGYQSANRAIAAAAKKHDIPLIDNRARFALLFKEKRREKYFEDNDYLTPAGYRVLAGGVSKKLIEEGLFARR